MKSALQTLDTCDTQELRVRDLGRCGYAAALQIQRETHDQVLRGSVPPTLLFVEHDPVITVSQRKTAPAHLRARPEALRRLGIQVYPTDRGGDITYHGPGQLVAYPIVRLADLGLNVGRYMRTLEQAVIDSAASFGVQAGRVPGCTGVWVAGSRKLCALGIRVRKNVSMHGLALNVTTDLSHFDTIVPCGLEGREVTSLQALLGAATPPMTAVKRELARQLCRRLCDRT